MIHSTNFWFFHVCYNEEMPWTMIFSYLLALVPIVLLIHLIELFENKKYSNLSLILCCCASIILNELVFKPSLNIPPLQDSCTDSVSAPSSSIAAISSAATLSFARIFLGPKNAKQTAVLSITLFLEFISRLVLNYLTFGYAVLSLVPGIICSIAFVALENTVGERRIKDMINELGLKNDCGALNSPRRKSTLLPE